MSEVHFITGAGSGMGQLAARRALAAGHKVAALLWRLNRWLENHGPQKPLFKSKAEKA